MPVFESAVFTGYFINNEMDETLIVRYLNGELSAEERSLFIDRVNHDAEFRRLFIETKNIWVLNVAMTAQGDEAIGVHFHELQKRMSGNKRDKMRVVLRYCRNIAAVLFLPLLVVSAMFFLNRTESGLPVVHSVFTPVGVKSCMELPDGTKVWLNSGTKLSYPAVFTGGKRSVVLDGEACFEVKPDKGHPFHVSLPDGGRVEVLGTVFDVSCYRNDPYVKTVLVEGEVMLHQSGKSLRMSPGECVTYTRDKNRMERENVNAGLYTAWKDGKLIFRDTPMDEVVRKLERWYGVDVQVAGPDILNNRITATFSGENLTQVLDLLKMSSPIDYKVNTNVVFLSAK